MKKLFILSSLLALFVFKVSAQTGYIAVCCDDTICTPGTAVTLTASVDTGFNVGTVLNIADDTYSQVVDLGFSFTFMGNTYTQCVLSTNAYICFDISQANQYSQWPIGDAAPSPNNPLNCIYGPWHDVDPSVISNPSLSYALYGDAPNRYFIYSFCQVPMFQCNDTLFTGQIVLYETSNIIEIHLGEKRECYSWNGGAAIEGLQDATGTVAYIVPGRNYPTQWLAFNDAYRFTPQVDWSYTIDQIPYVFQPLFQTTWYDVNGNFIGSGPSVTVTPNNTTTYYAQAAACGSTSYSDSVTITVADFTGDYSSQDPSCATAGDGSAHANGLGSTGPFTYVWIDSNGDTIQVHNSAGADDLNNLNAGSYTVIITNSFGCTTTNIFLLGQLLYGANFTWTQPACEDSTISFTNTSTGNPSAYLWNLGGGNTSTQQDVTHTFPGAGTYPVTLTITLPGGCQDSLTQNVTVFPNIKAGFDYASAPYCVGSQITFNDTSNEFPIGWAWDFGDDNFGSGSNPTHSYSSAGTYTVTLNVADSLCGADVISEDIQIYDYANPDLGPDTSVCPREVLLLDPHVIGTAYLWSTEQTTPTISVTVPETPSYYWVTVSNNGCNGTDSLFVNVNCILTLPNAFSPNGDGFNDLLRPLGSRVTDVTLTIYNRWGQEIYFYTGSDLSQGWNGTYDSEPAEVGVYVYILKGTYINGEAVTLTGNVTLVR